MTVKPTEILQPGNGQILVATYDTDVLDSGNWLQQVIAGTNTDKVQGTALDHLPQGGDNWAVNGSFDYWFSGTSFSTAGAFLHMGNGWEIFQGAAARDTSGIDLGSTASLSFVPAVAGGTVLQYVPNPTELHNRTVTLRARILTASVTGVHTYLQDDTGIISPVILTTNTAGLYVTVIAEATVSAAATNLFIVFVGLDTTAFNVDNVSLQPGYGAIDSFPKQPAAEYLAMDNRRGTGAFHARFRSAALLAQTETFYVPWRGALDVAPVVNISYTPNPGVTDNNLASLTVLSSDVNGCQIQVTPTAAATDTYIFGATLTWDTNL